MGIQGLLPQLKPIQNPVSLHRYEGQILGIDGYAWLHRAAYSCSYELAMDKPTDKYLQFFIKKIGMLRHFKIEPYIIFDGGSIGVKKETELKRREKRVENRTIAERLWNSGNKSQAMDYFQKSVDITPEMAKCVIDYCKTNKIKYIVAPFEADSQMVYLEKHGHIDGIISEDSDLLVFGCRKLITKLNDYGECIEICSDDFQQLKDKFPLSDLTLDGIRTMVSLSGCDYTNGIPKVGLLRAIKLVQRFKSMEKILNHIKLEGKLTIPSTFEEEYELANYSFQFQRVYCPERRQIVTLNEIPEQYYTIPNIIERIAESIGKPINIKTKERFVGIAMEDIDHNLHTKIALGDLNSYNYNKPLANREIKLQLTTKSEIVESGNRFLPHNNITSIDITTIKSNNNVNRVINKPMVVRNRSIESYFGMKIKGNSKPTRSNTTIGTVPLTLLDNNSQPSVFEDRRYFSTNGTTMDNVALSLQRQEEKTNKIINRRKLTVRAMRSSSTKASKMSNTTRLTDSMTMGQSTSVSNDGTNKLTTSKFFQSLQNQHSSPALVQNNEQRFRQPSIAESEASTEVPESQLSTQISVTPCITSAGTAIKESTSQCSIKDENKKPDDQHNDDETYSDSQSVTNSELSELSDNEHDDREENRYNPISDDSSDIQEEEDQFNKDDIKIDQIKERCNSQTRKLVGCKMQLSQFAYKKNNDFPSSDSINDIKKTSRLPFQEFNPNQRSKNITFEKNKINKPLKSNKFTERSINSLVYTIKGELNSDENVDNTNNTANNKEFKRIGLSKGIELRVSSSRSSSQIFEDSDNEMKPQTHKSPIKRIVVRSSKRSISSLSCFSYNGS